MFLRQLLKITKGCPISQLYLETEHYPARFAIIRKRLPFLKNVLNENTKILLELENIDVKQFKRILEKSIKIKSFEYLMGRRGRKGEKGGARESN